MNPLIIDYAQSKALPLSVAKKGCFVINMPNDVYHAYEGISKSGLDLIANSPALYAARKPNETTRPMQIGTALHAGILEPHIYASDFHLLPDIKDRRSSEYKKLKEIHGEAFVFVGEECANLDAMIKQAHTDAEVMSYMNAGGISEMSAFIQCPEAGVLLRCRYDYLMTDSDVCIDVKKTKDAREVEFSKSIDDFRYHVQDAMYSYVYKLLTGRELVFKFLAIQEKTPHTARIYTLDEYSKMIGYYYYHRDLMTFAECHKINFWPQPSQNGEISLPYWAINRYEEENDINMMDEFTGDEQ